MRNFKQKLIILSSACAAMLLQACIPAALLAGAAITGVVVYDSRNMPTIATDKNISTKAYALLEGNKELKNTSHVGAASFNRVVLLVGQTPNQDLKTTAENLVRSIEGVKRVYNEIVIAAPIDANTRSHDAWLTTEVKAKLLEQQGLTTTQLKVITEDSIVYLMGIVTHKQGQSAAETASKVNGVKKIVKVFEYKD